MKAMILAAGLGTRLRPLTNDRPKALVEISGKTLLEWNIQRLKRFGFTEIIINVHHHAQQIVDFVKAHHNFGIHIEFSEEEELLDTGGGIKKAHWFLEDAPYFLVHNVDVLTDMNYENLVQCLKSGQALSCLAVRRRKTSRYLLFDDRMRLSGWQNVESGEKRLTTKKEQHLQAFSFMGIQVMRPQIFDFFPQKEKFPLINALLDMAQQRLTISGYLEQKARWLDVGKKESLPLAREFVKDWL